jgi:hypothetical protein
VASEIYYWVSSAHHSLSLTLPLNVVLGAFKNFPGRPNFLSSGLSLPLAPPLVLGCVIYFSKVTEVYIDEY